MITILAKLTAGLKCYRCGGGGAAKTIPECRFFNGTDPFDFTGGGGDRRRPDKSPRFTLDERKRMESFAYECRPDEKGCRKGQFTFF